MSSKKYLSPFIIFCLAFLWFVLGCNYGINIYDEAIGIVGAARVLNGEIPYRDFWTIYSPLWFYVLAGWMKIFGSDIFTVRLLTIIINSLSIYIIYKTLIKQEINPYLATLSATMFLSISPFYGRAIPLAILLTLCIIYLLLDKHNYKKFAIVGICVAILFMVRHDFGVYCIAGLTIILIFRNKFIEKIDLRLILSIIITFLLIIALYFGLLYITGAFTGYIEYAYRFVFEKFSATRALPFPNPIRDLFYDEVPFASRIFSLWQSLIFYIPFLIIVSNLILIYKSRIDLKKEGLFFFTITTFTLFYSLQGMVRSGYEHIIPSLLISIMIITPLLLKFRLANKYVIFAVILFTIIPPTAKKLQSTYLSFSSKTIAISSEKGKFIKLLKDDGEKYNDLIEYIKIFDRSKYLYSGVLYHEKIFINDIMLYHLTNRKPATKYHELHPGQATETQVQEEIIQDLKTKDVPLIVLYYDKESEKQKFVGDNLLDEFIRERYILSKIFGNYFVFRKKLGKS